MRTIAHDIIGVCLLTRALAYGAARLLVSLALVSYPAIAHAESRPGPRPRFSWPQDLPPDMDCATYAGVEQRLEDALGGPLSEHSLDTEYTVHIERAAGHYRLVLVTESAGVRGERVIEGESCDEVADAVVLMIALGVEGARGRQATPPAPRPPVQAAEPVASQQSPVPSRAATPKSPGEGTRWEMRAGALVDLGYLPRAGVGLELGVSVRFARARFELSALGLPGVRSERAADGAHVRVSLWAARASYCHRLLGDRISLWPCLGAELGSARGEGIDLRDARDTSFVWFAGWLSVRGVLALSRQVALSLAPALALPLSRRRFVSSDAQGAPAARLHTPALYDVRVALSVEVAF